MPAPAAGVYAYGIEKPSLAQMRGIPALASGRDLIAQALSGSGKTACFALGALQRLDNAKRGTQCIILVHEREAASQIERVCSALGDYLGRGDRRYDCPWEGGKLRGEGGKLTHLFIGGRCVRADVSAAKSGVRLAVG
jgi:superfamily II DNA/RNA helicase